MTLKSFGDACNAELKPRLAYLAASLFIAAAVVGLLGLTSCAHTADGIARETQLYLTTSNATQQLRQVVPVSVLTIYTQSSAPWDQCADIGTPRATVRPTDHPVPFGESPTHPATAPLRRPGLPAILRSPLSILSSFCLPSPHGPPPFAAC